MEKVPQRQPAQGENGCVCPLQSRLAGICTRALNGLLARRDRFTPMRGLRLLSVAASLTDRS